MRSAADSEETEAAAPVELAVRAGQPLTATVLLIEDEPGIVDFVRRGLESEGFAVVEAENGRVALERLRGEPPSLILLDLMMPEMDGFAVVAALQKKADWRDIPVIVITSMGSGQLITRTGRYKIFPIIGSAVPPSQLEYRFHSLNGVLNAHAQPVG